MTNEFADQNWCDIETLYFKTLLNIESHSSIFELNKQFEEIKGELKLYLEKLPPYNLKHNYLNEIFIHHHSPYLGILNFNYTENFSNFINPGSQIFNIHGSLKVESNPIIFGYAATEQQIGKLRELNNEYMRNIKRTNYNFTSHYKNLLQFLDMPSRSTSNKSLEVIILGHSCGESDQLILSEIFNNQFVKSIEILYYDREAYFQQVVNIEKLIKNETDYNKIVDFSSSLRIPQKNEDRTYSEILKKYIK